MAQRPTVKQPKPLSAAPVAPGRIPQAEGGPSAQMLESLQAEISSEAAPLWNFVIDNVRVIALAVVVLVLAISGYAAWQWSKESSREAALLELARITSRQDHATRLGMLETFAKDAPKSVRPAVSMELAASALAVEDLDKAVTAYREAVRLEGKTPLASAARMSLANVLARQEKYAEALVELDTVLPTLTGDAALMIQEQIAEIAEAGGMKDRAVSAYEAVLAGLAGSDPTTEAYYRSAIARLK